MKLFKQTGLFLSAALLTFACGAPSETVETSEAKEVAEATGQTLNLDMDATTISWRGYKPAGQHFGKIPATEGSLVVTGDEITGGKFTFDITGLKIEDLEEGSENYGKLWGHLQSPDFFDAANHPTATFEITGIEPFAAGDVIADMEQFETDNTPMAASELSPETPTHWISGNLTMRGTSKNIKFPAAVAMENGVVTAKAGFNIDRTEWGLSYGDEANAVDKAKDQFIYNTVSLMLDVKAN
ncbi:YceI family protein [Algoriphagus sp. NF]|jgi:polyisoprenoid-binding protein YceI|uniref:YceI family protein n=1 Tax=Algoriphagus marincola TaxID=264027 RepID=A0ABS7N7T6_9BACT|nr:MULTISPECIES: YceI family protein [Algoriphagus]MBY5952396.1 YceI family protein [Algoriphagus marincola]MDE0560151.1 YceI family protein [Algoriphagus sp. NF]